MTGRSPALGLLAWAAGVASASISGAVHADPRSPTPCAEWDLGILVRHVADSAATIRELLEGSPPAGPPPAGCGAARAELRRLAEAIDSTPPNRPDLDLTALTGAYELAVHAWDIDRATGRPDQLPIGLVDTLLVYAPAVLGEIERCGLFAAEVPPLETRTDTDRLLAMFGRRGNQPLRGD
ncbi:hypothetical protein GCM10023322_07310 [Rugosimonospora acidiphila]|uniref:Mycothiol-dependent maleylpyruvate isomerase metal-binding domain-containing protein n=1 Tax=Rugosimonospora acidiphila TaxID=556531 RepID=A0ABP9RKA4_9ACTN